MKKSIRKKAILITATFFLFIISGHLVFAANPIKIAHVYGKTGPYEPYAKQAHNGLMMGLEYATNGTMKVLGRNIIVIEKDTQIKPELGKALLEEAYGDDEVDIAIGPISSGVAVAMLPVAAEYEKILLVGTAVANSITGKNSNRYIFKTSRNSSMDAIALAKAVGREKTYIATLAADYAFGRDGTAAFVDALKGTGAAVIHQEFAPTGTKDFTAAGQRIIDSLKDLDGTKLIMVTWAGAGNPTSKLAEMNLDRYGIQFVIAGNILPAMKGYKKFEGMEGATNYYYENPDNKINDWLVSEYLKRYGTPPDMFDAGGMTAGIAIVEGIRRAGSTDTEKLIKAFEGMHWDTPKGDMYFRPSDHQALQSMYHFKLRVDPNVEWAIPQLIREIKYTEMDVPVGINHQR